LAHLFFGNKPTSFSIMLVAITTFMVLSQRYTW
jgi:hypothetical protein